MQITHPSLLGRDQWTDFGAAIIMFFSLKCLLDVPTKGFRDRGGFSAQAALSVLAVCSNAELQRTLF